MTNKVKPFFIRITDDMTPQIVQDAFDKCIDAGADAQDGIKNTNMKHKYNDLYHLSFEYVGVDYENNTYTTIGTDAYGESAKEITLDQLDEWLGLEVEREWKNGDECVIRSEKLIYIGESIEADIHCVQEPGTCIYRNAHISVIEKPETPEQKAERERLREQEEARKNALEMLEEVSDVKNANVNIDCTYAIAATVKAMIELGYRKQ